MAALLTAGATDYSRKMVTAAASTMSDEAALVARAQDGDARAFESLYRLHIDKVYGLCLRMTANPSLAEDCVQQTYLQAWRNLPRFRGDSAFGTWLHRIAVNEAHNQRRWFGRHRKREVGLENEDGINGRSYGDSLPDPGRSPFDITLDGETMNMVEESLARIKPVFREAVILRDVEDLSYEEVAQVLQVSLGTVKSRILRGREALRRQLSARLEQERTYGWNPQPAGQD